MARKRYSPEAIIMKLREAEVELSKGQTVKEVVRKLGITEQTYYRWRNKYGGMDVSEVKRLRELEKENAELKRIVAEQMLDIRMLKDVNSKKW